MLKSFMTILHYVIRFVNRSLILLIRCLSYVLRLLVSPILFVWVKYNRFKRRQKLLYNYSQNYKRKMRNLPNMLN